jgi:hypothetical protein
MARGFFAKHEVSDHLLNFLLMLAASRYYIFFAFDLATFVVPLLINLGAPTVTKTPIELAAIVTSRLIAKLCPILDHLVELKDRVGVFFTLDSNEALSGGRFDVVEYRRRGLVKSLASLIARYIRLGVYGVSKDERTNGGGEISNIFSHQGPQGMFCAVPRTVARDRAQADGVLGCLRLHAGRRHGRQ